MTVNISPADMPQRRETGIGPVTEGHAQHIRGFAFFPYRGVRVGEAEPAELGRRAWAGALTALADLAEPEDWTGAGAAGRPLPILDSFLRYTYQRLVMDDKIAVTENGITLRSTPGC